ASAFAQPRQEKTAELPHCIQPETTGHDRITVEVTLEKPQLGVDIQFRQNLPIAVFAAIFRDVCNAVEHKHGRSWQAGIALAKQLAAAAGQKLVVVERGGFGHVGLGWLYKRRCRLGANAMYRSRSR